MVRTVGVGDNATVVAVAPVTICCRVAVPFGACGDTIKLSLLFEFITLLLTLLLYVAGVVILLTVLAKICNLEVVASLIVPPLGGCWLAPATVVTVAVVALLLPLFVVPLPTSEEFSMFRILSFNLNLIMGIISMDIIVFSSQKLLNQASNECSSSHLKNCNVKLYMENRISSILK